MRQTFVLRKEFPKLQGYIWKADREDHIMLLLMGAGEFAGQYDRVCATLNDRGITVVSFDYRGCGKSEGKRGEISPRKWVLSDIDHALIYISDNFTDIPISILGFSIGGNLLIDYMRRKKKKAVPAKYVIISPWIKLADEPSWHLHPLIRFFARMVPGYKIYVSQYVKKSASVGEKGEEIIEKSDMKAGSFINLKTAIEFFDAGLDILKADDFGDRIGMEKPIMLMHGTNDSVCLPYGSRKIAEKFSSNPNFTYVEWPGYGHRILDSCRENSACDVIETIGDFITSDQEA